MKKRSLLLSLLSIAFVVTSVFAFSSCKQGEKGEQGIQGETGKSAYEIWLELGNEGTEEDFLNWLKVSSTTESLQYQKIDGKDEYRVIGLGTISSLDIPIRPLITDFPLRESGRKLLIVERVPI